MRVARSALLVIVAAGWTATLATAQELVDASAEELVAREEVRLAVESALGGYLASPSTHRIDAAIDATDSLLGYGKAAVPYLANELEQELLATFDLVSYALGRLHTPEAAAALREAVKRAEADIGQRAVVHKAYACWALGLHREIDALDLVNGGNHQSGFFAIHERTSVLEVIALQTAPESVPKLLDFYDLWSQSEELKDQRKYALRALRRISDPASLPRLIAILHDAPEPVMRSYAAQALSTIETADSVEALLAALDDSEVDVQRQAAYALRYMEARVDPKPLLERLGQAKDPNLRGALYALIAAEAGPEEIRGLIGQWGRPNNQDRRYLIDALATIESDEVTELRLGALSDPSNTVVAEAVRQLARSGEPAAIERLRSEAERTSERVVLQAIALAASSEQLSDFAPILARRLVEVTHQDHEQDTRLRTMVRPLADALVNLRYTAALSKLKKARKGVKDSLVIETLDETIASLGQLRENGRDASKWAALLKSPQPYLRRLALDQLAELGGDEQAAGAIVAAFDRAPDVEQNELLLALADHDTPAARGLVRRVLMDWTFDPSDREPQRANAAWIARNWGGQEMYNLLVESARRREGRDAWVLLYAAALGGKQALPLLGEYRLSRMLYLKGTRGKEQEVLDWVSRGLERGRSIERYDVEPRKMRFG